MGASSPEDQLKDDIITEIARLKVKVVLMNLERKDLKHRIEDALASIEVLQFQLDNLKNRKKE